MAASVEEIRKAQRAQGAATILAIGTATPSNCVNQADYPDFYFRITKSEHMTELKEKFKRISEAFSPIGISDWNSIFWIAHPGGPAILNQVEAKLSLKPEKMRASRHVLSEYGNMTSACVLFILDEMRKKSLEEGKVTTGEGLEWGVLFGFGPGLTIETVVLHSIPTEMAAQ
ncbi:hypothetical protein GH714_027727 [Hevea brasiliensis]|uniref:Chalcone/stilbene synthase C-terminal domain-containing protein n=1 Tax=Hevea brasiliensis TaxID=3981 RepID=A0A6A6KXF6_HEVBR|nr:hypothetical protein GH714_027727 [Hevea brasiliensis]